MMRTSRHRTLETEKLPKLFPRAVAVAAGADGFVGVEGVGHLAAYVPHQLQSAQTKKPLMYTYRS